jgi:hypothetical protein
MTQRKHDEPRPWGPTADEHAQLMAGHYQEGATSTLPLLVIFERPDPFDRMR